MADVLGEITPMPDMTTVRAIQLLTDAENNEEALKKSLEEITRLEHLVRELEYINDRLLIAGDTARRDASMATQTAMLLRLDLERITNNESAGGITK